jgi:hypothetical protein
MSRTSATAIHKVGNDSGSRRKTRSSPAKLVDPAHQRLARQQVGNRGGGSLLGEGKPLDSGVRADMETRFGESLGDVRIHDAESAHRSAAGLNAKAYTVGDDIAFNADRYAPHTAEGRRLLAHELAHVIQQRRGGTAPPLTADAAHEASANTAAMQIASGAANVHVAGATAVGIARDPEDEKKKAGSKANNEPSLQSHADVPVPDVFKKGFEPAPALRSVREPVDAPPPQSHADMPVPKVFKKALETGPAYWAQHRPDFSAMEPQEMLDGANQIQEWLDIQSETTPEVVRLENLRDEFRGKARARLAAELRARKQGSTTRQSRTKKAPAATADAGKSRFLRERGSIIPANSAALNEELREIESDLGRKDISDEDRQALQVELMNLLPLLQEDLQARSFQRKSATLEKAAGGDLQNLARVLDSIKEEQPGRRYLRQGNKAILALSNEEARAFKRSFESNVLDAWATRIDNSGRELDETAEQLLQYVRLSMEGASEQQMFQALQRAEEALEDPDRAEARQRGGLAPLWYHTKRTARNVYHGAKAAVEEPFKQVHDLGLIAGHGLFGVDVSEDDLVSGVAQASKAGESRLKILASAIPETAPIVTTGDMIYAGATGNWDALGEMAGGVLGGHFQSKAIEHVSGAGRSGSETAASKRLSSDAFAQERIGAPDPAVLKEWQQAEALAKAAETTAKKKQTSAEDLQQEAQKKADRAKQLSDKAQERKDFAQTKAERHSQKEAEAQAKQDAAAEVRDKAQRQAARAKKGLENAQLKAQSAERSAQKADGRAKEAAADADKTRTEADAAKKDAAAARAKADALKPPPDPDTVFDRTKEPIFGDAPDSALPTNTEPIVWVRTESGDARGTYVAEGTEGFGKGEGIAMPQSQADSYFRPADTAFKAKPIQRRVIGGREVESKGAGGEKGSTFISATARHPDAINSTSIRADVSEVHSYDYLIEQGEFGLLRPQGSNIPGVDSITVRVRFNADGTPESAQIFLNDATTPTAEKIPKEAHADWHKKLVELLNQGTEKDPNYKGPGAGETPEKWLDFGDEKLESVIHDAVTNNEVYVRITRVDPSLGVGKTVQIRPSEIWRLGPTGEPIVPEVTPSERPRVPLVPPIVKKKDRDKKDLP